MPAQSPFVPAQSPIRAQRRSADARARRRRALAVLVAVPVLAGSTYAATAVAGGGAGPDRDGAVGTPVAERSADGARPAPDGPAARTRRRAAVVSGYEVVRSAPVAVTAGASGTATASCPAGKVPVGGGYDTADSVDLELNRSGPTASATSAGWYVRVTNDAGSTREVVAQAVCVLAG